MTQIEVFIVYTEMLICTRYVPIVLTVLAEKGSQRGGSNVCARNMKEKKFLLQYTEARVLN